MTTPAEPTYRLHRPTVAVWRSPGVLQVGLDADAVVLEGVGQLAVEAVRCLHSPVTLTELERRLPGMDPDLTRRLCAHLSSAGLLSTEPTPPSASVAVLGEGRLADAVLQALDRVAVRSHRLPEDAIAEHCDALSRAERDPAWARVLDQLCRLTVAADQGLLAWAVASVVNQVRAWQGGACGELHNRCLAVSAPEFAQSVRHWHAQPGCWCATLGVE